MGQIESLEGIPGLNKVSEDERNAFMLNNADKLKQYKNPIKKRRAAEVLYNNQKFISTFGQEVFDQMNDGSKEAYEKRNQLLREKLIDDAFKKNYAPVDEKGNRDNTKGLGKDWEKYYNMSTDAKEKLLNSDWKTNAELEAERKKRTGWLDKAVDFVAGEAIQQYKKDSNQKILDKIYNEDADKAASQYSDDISLAHANPDIVGRTDRETKQLFVKAITPDSSKGNLGISEYASHYGTGQDGEVSSEMEDFTVEDMRKILAKKAVYDYYMTPEMANTALNNEAKRYLRNHQSDLKVLGLFAKDVGISALSYTADKVNSLVNLGLMVEDKLGGIPKVYIDDAGNVVDPKKNRIEKDSRGNLSYKDASGKTHAVSLQEVSRTALHNMGKNADGSDDTSLLNPLYWTRAEQFGTLDEDEQLKYEKLGSSPYKVAYDPNEDTDLVYESFKMMSFGLADAASMMIPFGIGIAGKSLSAASKLGSAGRALGRGMEYAGKMLSAESKLGQVSQGLVGAGGIAYAYQRGAFQETLAKNLADAEEALVENSRQDIYNAYNKSEGFKQRVDGIIDMRAAEIKADRLAKMNAQERASYVDGAYDDRYRAIAQQEVLDKLVQQRIEDKRKSPEYAALQQKAIDEAGDAATTTFLPEAIKYGFVNTIGFRKFLYSHPTSLTKRAKRASKNFKGLTEKTVTKQGVGETQRLVVDSQFKTLKDKAKTIGKIVGSQALGGAWTNGTDDMMVDAAERINSDRFKRDIDGYANPEAMVAVYATTDWFHRFANDLSSYAKGLQNSLGQTTTWDAALIGGAGSLVSASPHLSNILHFMTKEGREAFRKNFQTRYERNEDGTIAKDKDGNSKMKDVPWSENFLDRASYFIQNGVLNEYYGRKQGERFLQEQADFLNKILDEENDFAGLEALVASDMVHEDAKNTDEVITDRFIKAFRLAHLLNTLTEGEEAGPGLLSSIVTRKREFLDKAAAMTFDENGVNHNFTEEELLEHLGAYKSVNPDVDIDSTEGKLQALKDIASNARKIKEAAEAYAEANAEIQKIERASGKIDYPMVREKIMEAKALSGNLEERIAQMKSEIGDVSTSESKPTGSTLIATVGGRKNAQVLVKTYDKQRKELEGDVAEKEKEIEAANKRVEEAEKKFKNAKGSNEIYEAEAELNDAKANVEDLKLRREHFKDLITRTNAKQKSYQDALDELDENSTDKILTADEIFALDSVTRTVMLLNSDRRGLITSYEDEALNDIYSDEQLAEINKLKSNLLSKDADALQKLMDIGILETQLEATKNVYEKLANNPIAAGESITKDRYEAFRRAVDLFNSVTAQGVATFIDNGVNAYYAKGESQETVNGLVYRTLRTLSPEVLDIIEKEQYLPDFTQQLADAKAWTKLQQDIAEVINKLELTDEERDDFYDKIHTVAQTCGNQAELFTRLEKIIDTTADKEFANNLETFLKRMSERKYLRDTAVLEDRKHRQERNEAAGKAMEESKKAAQDAAQKAGEEAAKKKEALKDKEEGKNNIVSTLEGTQVDENSVPREDVYANAEKEIENEENSEVKEVREDSNLEFSDWITPATLMEEDTESTTVDAGEMWTSGEYPQKGNMEVILEKDGDTSKITFSNNGEPETLLVQLDKDSSIEVESIENEGNGWYFNDINKATSQGIKVPDNFNLDEAINEQRAQRIKEAEDKGVVTEDEHIIEDAEGAYGVTPSLEEYAKEVDGAIDSHKVSTEANPAEEIVSSASNGINRYNSKFLSANSLYPYNASLLFDEDHTVVEKPDTKGYRAWLKANNIPLQEIIDRKLHKIIAAKKKKGEDLKIKFMCTNPGKNSDGRVVKDVLFLVVDYDNDVQGIHKESEGGVISSISEKDHKTYKYLVVGAVGYGSTDPEKVAKEERDINLARQNLFNNVYGIGRKNKNGEIENIGLLRKGTNAYFSSSATSASRFRVLEDVYTNVVPLSLIPGSMVKRHGTNEAIFNRTLGELLSGKDTNPFGFTFDTIKLGIQEWTTFYTSREDIANVMKPRNVSTNVGGAFILIPASNGMFLPVAIKPWNYQDLVKWNKETGRGDALLDEIKQSIIKLSSLDYAVRKKAIEALYDVFHMDKNDKIIISRRNNIIDFIEKNKDTNADVTIASVDLKVTGKDTIKELEDAFELWNPRINITPSALGNRARLIELDDAGALQTDCQGLYTVGSEYSIYPVDTNGNIIKDSNVSSYQKPESDSAYRNEVTRQVKYNNQDYYYNIKSGEYTLLGQKQPISDEALIKELDYNREINERGLVPSAKFGVWDYYIMDANLENPKVIKVNGNTHKVEEANVEVARDFIKKYSKDKDTVKRDAEAKDKLKDVNLDGIENQKEKEPSAEENKAQSFIDRMNNATTKEEVEAAYADGLNEGISEENLIDTYSNRIMELDKKVPKEEEKKKEEAPVEQQKHNFDDVLKGSLEKSSPSASTSGTATFEKILQIHKDKKVDIYSAISKVPGSPLRVEVSENGEMIVTKNASKKEIREFLKEKNIPVDSINSSEAGLQAWLHTIKCRQ